MTEAITHRAFIREARALNAVIGVLPLVMLLLVVGFALVQPNFVSTGNLVNIAIQTSYLAIFALAQTYVVIVRGFDLSLGTSVSLVSVASGMMIMGVLQPTAMPAFAIAAGLAGGMAIALAIGTINGFAVAVLGLNPFVATLAMLNICLGLASTISGGFQIFNLPDALNHVFYRSQVLHVPTPIVAAACLLGASFVVFHFTRFGRALYLIGSNPRAALVAGLPVRRYLMAAYVVAGFQMGCGALLLTARTGSGEPNLGGNLMLESIAAAVVGGASLRGGKGGVAPPLLGALLITMLSNGMNLTRIDGYVQQMIMGFVILATAFGDARRTRARSHT